MAPHKKDLSQQRPYFRPIRGKGGGGKTYGRRMENLIPYKGTIDPC